MPWYTSNDRYESEKLLNEDSRDGVFLVRPSKSAQMTGDKVRPLVLSVYRGSNIYHFAIIKTGSQFHLEGKSEVIFDSVSELIEFYKGSPITKIKPSRHEIEIMTGRKFTGKRSSFLGVEGSLLLQKL